MGGDIERLEQGREERRGEEKRREERRKLWEVI